MAEVKISGTLVNDTKDNIVAFAKQIKDDILNWDVYNKISEELNTKNPDTTDLSKFQSDINDIVLDICNRFLIFTKDLDNADETINTWKEIEAFLAGYKDDSTLTSIVQLLNSEIQSRLTVPLENTTGDSTTSTLSQKALSTIYGDIIDNPEFIRAITDKENRLLFGIKSDGSIYWEKGIPNPVKESILNLHTTIKETIDNILSYEDCNILIDSEDKVIENITRDGIKEYNTPQRFKRPVLFEETIKVNSTATLGLKDSIKTSKYSIGLMMDLSNVKEVYLSEPKLATVNIIAEELPTDFQITYLGSLEFWDNNGHYFKKPISMGVQGNVSKAWALEGLKQNIKFDLLDGSEIQFGNWVAQDSFHLKGSYNDFTLCSLYPNYKLAKLVMDYLENRLATTNTENEVDLTLTDTGDDNTIFGKKYGIARSIPDAFPFELYWTYTNDKGEVVTEYRGLYTWGLKKHRKNYGMNKKDAGNILIDPTLYMGSSGPYKGGFWTGDINWSTIELRNPKDMFQYVATKVKYCLRENIDNNNIITLTTNNLIVGDIVVIPINDDNIPEVNVNHKDCFDIYQVESCTINEDSIEYVVKSYSGYNYTVYIISNINTTTNTCNICTGIQMYNGDAPSELIDAIGTDSNSNILPYPTGLTDKKLKEIITRTVTAKNNIKNFAAKYQDLKATNEWDDNTKLSFNNCFDKNSIIALCLINMLLGNSDSITGNTLVGSLDASSQDQPKIKFYIYDVDHCFDANWTGTLVLSTGANNPDKILSLYQKSSWPVALYLDNISPIDEEHYSSELQTTYKELRDNGILSLSNIYSIIDAWTSRIGTDAYFRDKQRWPQTPSYRKSNLINTDKWKCLNTTATLSSIKLKATEFDSNKTYNEDDEVYVLLSSQSSAAAHFKCISNGVTVPPYTILPEEEGIKYTDFPRIGGYFNSPERIKAWLKKLLELMDWYLLGDGILEFANKSTTTIENSETEESEDTQS